MGLQALGLGLSQGPTVAWDHKMTVFNNQELAKDQVFYKL